MYLLFFVLSFFLIMDEDVLRGREGAASALILRAAIETGPGWAGGLGGEVTGHELVVLLVGPHCQCGLALETGSEV